MTTFLFIQIKHETRNQKSSDSGDKRPRDAETGIVVPEVNGVSNAACRAQLLWRVVPGAAAVDTPSTILTCRPRRAILRSAVVVVMTAILNPFPNIAVHVVHAKSIGGERADRNRLLVVPLTAATFAVGVALADLVAPRVGRRCSGARGILPLGFGQQPVGLPSRPGKPGDVALGFSPGDVDHRAPAASIGAILDPCAIAILDTGIPLVERHLELGHGEELGEHDLMLGAFFVIAAFFISWRSHYEFTCRHDHHPGAVLGALSEGVLWLERLFALGSEYIGPNLCLQVWANGHKLTDLLPQIILVQPANEAGENDSGQHAKKRSHPLHPPLNQLFGRPAGVEIIVVSGLKTCREVCSLSQPLRRFQPAGCVGEPSLGFAVRGPVARRPLDALQDAEQTCVLREPSPQ